MFAYINAALYVYIAISQFYYENKDNVISLSMSTNLKSGEYIKFSSLLAMETKSTIFILIAFAIFLPDFIKCDCKINSGFYNFVGAFQKIDGKFYKIPDSNDLRLSTNAVLYLICPGGFK